jgi:hypothetical protein
MRTRLAFLLCLSVAALSAAPSDSGRLVVHEWGTFLAMNGSTGVSLDGMYHEEHALPSFVHARSRDQLRLPTSLLKGETPVIYFYTAHPLRAQVQVNFPTGLWTQWFPQASMVGPGLVQAGSPPLARNGRIAWDIDVVPRDYPHGTIPRTPSESLWNHARQVDSAYVSAATSIQPRAQREWERFLFYRGLGEAPLPIEIKANDGRITASTSEPAGLRHLFILRVEHGIGAFAYVPELTDTHGLDQAIPSMTTALPIDDFVSRVSDAVAQRLVESGLYGKEARAMVNTWRASYFKTEGLRVLFVLPQTWTERFIPMEIKPTPAELVRVMVGRVELLDAARERRAEEAIRNLASTDTAVRERAFDSLRAEGRYVEPIIRRMLQTTSDGTVRTLSQRLLLTDFVTELRTAVADAATGEAVRTDPLYVRALLADLLREVGLTDEARAEGQAVLTQLLARGKPRMSDHTSREPLRALARAAEGAGDDHEALRWYGQFVRFGSQSPTCNGCHTTEGPQTMAFYRDWWAGRKFGALAVRTGEAPALIAAHEADLAAAPRNATAQLSLAYLYEATGNGRRANEMWSMLIR